MFQQQKDKLATLENISDIVYTFGIKYKGERYTICINRTNSTEDHLEIDQVVALDTGENVTTRWFDQGIIDELEDEIHQKAAERFEYLRTDN